MGPFNKNVQCFLLKGIALSLFCLRFYLGLLIGNYSVKPIYDMGNQLLMIW